MRRREFIAGLTGAAVLPVVAPAQQGDRVRRIGVLMAGDENYPAAKTFGSAFTQALAALGWTDGRNVRMDLRWLGNDINRIRALAHELVGLQPDIIVTTGGAATVAVQRETQTIPIVFASENRLGHWLTLAGCAQPRPKAELGQPVSGLALDRRHWHIRPELRLHLVPVCHLLIRVRQRENSAF